MSFLDALALPFSDAVQSSGRPLQTSDGYLLVPDTDETVNLVYPGPYTASGDEPFVIVPGETFWRVKFTNAHGVKYAIPVSAMARIVIIGAGTPPTQGLTPEEAAKRLANVNSEKARSAAIEADYEKKVSFFDALSESFKEATSGLTGFSKGLLGVVIAGVVLLVLWSVVCRLV